MAQSPIHSLAFGAGCLFAGHDHSVTVYAMPGLQQVSVLAGIEGRVAGIACDPDRRRLYVLASQISQPLYSAVYVWELPTPGGRFRLCRRLYGFGGGATCLAADSNGRWIAAGEDLGSAADPAPSQVLVWDASTLRLKNVLRYHKGSVGAMAFSTDGKYLITGDAGSIARPRDESPLYMYDMQADRLVRQVSAHRGGIRSIAIDPQGRFVVSGGVDGVWVWNIKRLTPYRLRGTGQTIFDFGPDVA
jgi:WD40 repeat protein